MPPQGNFPSLEDLMKQLAASNLEPQNADRIVSQHCEPFTVGRIQQPSLTNNFESERECECSNVEKWKRTISTSIAAAEINRSRLRTKCRDPRIFSVPCTIGECTFANAMLDLGASINVMPTSIYKALNFGDLEPTWMTIQLENRSVVQPLGILEDVIVQVNKLIFPTDFNVLDMEDETPGKGSTLILGRPFLMTTRTKIDVHVGTLSMEFGDILVQFNIFKAMKHPTEDHSLFGIDLIDELVEEYFQLDNRSEDIDNFAKRTDSIGYLGSISKEEADYAESGEVHNLFDSVDNNNDIVDLDFEAELLEVLDQVCKHENSEYSIEAEVQVAETKKLFSAQLATIFTTEYESAKVSRDRERTEVISAKKTMVKADLHVQTHDETIPAKEDQKQARAVFISDNKVLSGSDFKAKQRAESDSNPTRTNSIKRSRPQQPKAEISFILRLHR
ncbi:hypothetical protein CR513_54766, partial [Mucuna pruriens]